MGGFLRRLRDSLSELAGTRTRFPPPAAGDADEVRAALESFRSGSRDRYWRFFLAGRPHRASREEREPFRVFESAGLAEEVAGPLNAPCVRVFPLGGRYIATDLLTHHAPDQVFSLMLEQVYAVRNTAVRAGDRVLDLCTGSGVLGLSAAERAERVTAVDVSPRALSFARFNAALNPAPAPIELVEGDLFAPLDPEGEFDVVMVNPPFEPVPPGGDHFLHSHGGEDGLDVVRALLVEAPRRLKPGGRFEIVTLSPGSDREPALLDLMRDAFPGADLSFHVLDDEPAEEWLAPYRRTPAYGAWRDRLAAAGTTRFWLVFARATAGGSGEVEVVRPEEEIAACRRVVDEWYGPSATGRDG